MATTEFEDVKGFLPTEEAEKLRQWAALGAQVGPLLEVGSYCGLSTLHLAGVARGQNDHSRSAHPAEEEEVGSW